MKRLASLRRVLCLAVLLLGLGFARAGAQSLVINSTQQTYAFYGCGKGSCHLLWARAYFPVIPPNLWLSSSSWFFPGSGLGGTVPGMKGYPLNYVSAWPFGGGTVCCAYPGWAPKTVTYAVSYGPLNGMPPDDEVWSEEVTLYLTPEPATMVTMATGVTVLLIGYVGGRRRRRWLERSIR
jgi:hypothetical protein